MPYNINMSINALRFGVIVGVIGLAGLAVGQGYRYEVIPIGETYGIDPSDINEKGVITGGHTTGFAVTLDKSGLTFLPLLPGTTENGGQKINSNRDVLGAAGFGVLTKSVLWVDGKPIDLGMVRGEAGGDSATDLNDSLQVSAYVNGKPAIWEKGSVSLLELPAGTGGSASGINNDGSCVGTVIDAFSNYAALWDEREYTSLHPAGYTASRAFEIADNGDIGGEVSRHGLHNAALWRGGTEFIDLGNLAPGTPSYFNDLNSTGQVVGQSANSLGEFRGFLWEKGKMLSLTDMVEPGWDSIVNAWALNDAGQILAGGYPTGGPGQLVLLNPVPEPSSGVVLFVFATSLFLRRRLKRCAVDEVRAGRHRGLIVGHFGSSQPRSSVRGCNLSDGPA